MMGKMIVYLKNIAMKSVPLCWIISILLVYQFGWLQEAKSKEIIDRILAVVNDDVISLYEFNREFRAFAQQIVQSDYPVSQKREILDRARVEKLHQLIDQKLADQEIRRLNIKIDEKEIDNTIEHIRATNSYTDEEFRQALAMEGLRMEAYRQQLKDQVLRSRLVNMTVKSKIVVTEADIEKYYQEHPDEFQGKKRIHLRNIIMEVPPFATEQQKTGIYKKMEEVHQMLIAGGTFSELAAQYSESPLAAEGGDLGEFEFDSLSVQIQDAVNGFEPGSVTPVLDTDQGYQIFYIENIVPGENESLEEVSAEIEEKLFNEIVNQKYKNWLQDLRSKAHIKVIQ
jgi:peptidyl-prolyl cis-trans isomerase SurA